MTKTRLLARHLAREIAGDEAVGIGGAKMGTRDYWKDYTFIRTTTGGGIGTDVDCETDDHVVTDVV